MKEPALYFYGPDGGLWTKDGPAPEFVYRRNLVLASDYISILDELRAEVDRLRADVKSGVLGVLDEALNSGDGSYRP